MVMWYSLFLSFMDGIRAIFRSVLMSWVVVVEVVGGYGGGGTGGGGWDVVFEVSVSMLGFMGVGKGFCELVVPFCFWGGWWREKTSGRYGDG